MIAERFWTKVDRSEGSGACWPWTGAHIPEGYGSVRFEGRTQLAHRVAYRLSVGEIGQGLQLDHLCRNRGCVNPAHLEPVTPRVNTLRGEGPAARNAVATHCTNDHLFDEANTIVKKDGRRNCRSCIRESQARYNARNRERRNAEARERMARLRQRVSR